MYTVCRGQCKRTLQFLVSGVIFVDGGGGVGGGGLLEVFTDKGAGAVEALLEDGLLLDDFELGLEVLKAGGVGAAVGAATGVGQVVGVVFNLVALTAPIAFSSTIFLGLVGLSVGVASFSKVAWEMVFELRSTISNGGVVTVVLLVGSSHVDMVECRGDE